MGSRYSLESVPDEYLSDICPHHDQMITFTLELSVLFRSSAPPEPPLFHAKISLVKDSPLPPPFANPTRPDMPSVTWLP